MIFLADNSRRLQPVDAIDIPPFHGIGGGGGLWSGSFAVSLPASGGGGGSGGGSAPAASFPDYTGVQFDTSRTAIQRATARGNTEADIQSALELFQTGQTRGRALGYAQDIMRRFGAPDLRAAAANYLESAGLPRLAQVVSPGPSPVDDGAADSEPATKGPVELLLDALPALFGQATYNPPLQSQATGYTPVSSGGGIGGNIGMWLLLGGVAIAAYFIYKRYKSGSGG